MALPANNNFEGQFPPLPSSRSTPSSPSLSDDLQLTPFLEKTFADVLTHRPRPRPIPVSKVALSILDPTNICPAKPFVRSTQKHSIIYFIPTNQPTEKIALHNAIFEHFTSDNILGIVPKSTTNSYSVEIALPSADIVSSTYLAGPISVNNHAVHPVVTSSSANPIVKVNLTKLPLLPYSELSTILNSTMRQYGVVRDIVIYHDDLIGKFFQGNGHVLLEKPSGLSSSFLPLSHRIHLEDTSFLATWADMDIYCTYCKAMGHEIIHCPDRPQERRTCYTCNVKGHIAAKCPRAIPLDEARHQRVRRTEPTDPKGSRPIAPVTHRLPKNNQSQVSSPPPAEQPVTSSSEPISSVEEDPVTNTDNSIPLPEPVSPPSTSSAALPTDLTPTGPPSTTPSVATNLLHSPIITYRRSSRSNKGVAPDRYSESSHSVI